MQCAQLVPTGSNLYSLQIVPPINGECVNAVVLLEPSEFKNFAMSPFNLSAEDGAVISAAIVAVWGVGFAARALIKTLSGGTSHDENE